MLSNTFKELALIQSYILEMVLGKSYFVAKTLMDTDMKKAIFSSK